MIKIFRMNLIQVLKNSKMEKKKYQIYIKQKNNLNLNDKMTLNILVALLNKSKEQKGEETFALDYEDKDIEQFIREKERLQ